VSARIIQGDALSVLQSLPAASVHTVVTSPPYWKLRSYLPDDHPDKAREISNEDTIGEYIDRLVAVFREVRRVLRADGTVWMNLGDGYVGPVGGNQGLSGQRATRTHTVRMPKKALPGLKRKDLIGIPWKVAFALQDDGWWLRTDIVWEKPNPTPESVQDRPTRVHEYLFLLTPSARYYYDPVAIMEPVTGGANSRGNGVNPKAKSPGSWQTGPGAHDSRVGRHKQNPSFSAATTGMVTMRNKRSVWKIAPQPYPGEHYATFPEELVEPCVLAGTSERGACPVCGAPWRRLVQKTYVNPGNRTTNGPRSIEKAHTVSAGYAVRLEQEIVTLGWEPSCRCEAGEPVPCVVLDPFSGTGRTGVVALRRGRDYIGIELHPGYVEQSQRQITGDSPMFNTVSIEVPSCSV